MNTFKIILSYNGEAYCGWQVQTGQPHLQTVQGELQKALGLLTKEKITILGAGRTDAGVHAMGQTAFFQAATSIRPERLPAALNSLLPKDIVVVHAEHVPKEMHPIKDAYGKWYRYMIYSHTYAHVFYQRFAHHVTYTLNQSDMKAAAEHFIGTHNFKSFCVAKTDKQDYVREILACRLSSKGRLLYIDYYGKGFLHHMVRIMSGTLVEIGRRKYNPEAIPLMLKEENRRKAGPTAPACGLVLMRVDYKPPKTYFSTKDILDMPTWFD